MAFDSAWPLGLTLAVDRTPFAVRNAGAGPTTITATGGITVASAPARWEWLQSTYRIFQTIGIENQWRKTMKISK